MEKRVGTPILLEYYRMSLLKIPIFGAQPYGFKATDVSGCKVWLDATDVTTLYSTTPINGLSGFSDYSSADGQRVTVWEDKSPGANDMIRNVGTSFIDTSPQYMGPPIVAPDSYLTPLAVVNLDQGNVAPGDDSGGSSNSPSFLQQNLVAVGGYTASGGPGSARGPRVGTGISSTTEIFVIVKPKFLNVAGDVFSIGSQANKTADFTCLSITSSGYWKINSQNGDRDVTSSTPEVFNTFSNDIGADPNYRILHMSLSNNNYVLRRMGSVIGSNAGYSWSPNLANYRYYIGRKNSTDDAGNYFNGRIGEIIVYNEIITIEKRLVVESYLANKWNLIDLLPLDHPARLKNIPISLKGLSIAGNPTDYTQKGRMLRVFVFIPDPPTVSSLITDLGTTFTVSWSPAMTGGTPEYYNVTIFSSTDNSTWSSVQYLFMYTQTSFVYTIGGYRGDDKYYFSQVEARKFGGGATTVTTSILNSLPSQATNLSVAYYYDSAHALNSMKFNITAGTTGGIPTGYSLILYSSLSSDGSSPSAWSFAGTPVTIDIPYTAPTISYNLPNNSSFWSFYMNYNLTAGSDQQFVLGKYYYFTCTPYNGTGTDKTSTSSVFFYSTGGHG